jgi:hypothetical protein
MIDRNQRGRRLGTMGRLAIAAAVLVGGSAAAVATLDAGHGAVATVQSASFTASSHHPLSEAVALTAAFDDWASSPAKSLAALAEMKPVANFAAQQEHSVTFAAQRGIVVQVTKKFIVVRSRNGALHQWRLSSATAFKDVAGSAAGLTVLTGSEKAHPATRATKSVLRGDLVFVAGLRVHGTLTAKLVLFAAPRASKPKAKASPAATPSPNVTISGQPGEIGSHS